MASRKWPVYRLEDTEDLSYHPREHVATDSMVTVSLSEPVSTNEQLFEQQISNEEYAVPTEAFPAPKRQTSLEIMQAVDIESRSPDQESASDAATHARDSGNELTAHTSQDSLSPDSIQGAGRFRRNSASSIRSEDSNPVDWQELEKSEEQEIRDEASDESAAFLLARLEQENNSLATDPRFGGLRNRARSKTRPPSIHVLKKLVTDPTSAPTRYSLLPHPPPMTELEFWAALVKDYAQTAQRLPTLTANKIRGGVPPPLRGVVWVSMCGARDRRLDEEYERLCGETSPYENMIGKDIGRSFPGVEMFRDPEGEGQQMLGRVLKCFSLYDQKIGYCQGLGFLVGPLLMQMGDKDAFCILVRLMERYHLRSCFLPDLSGLHLRIFQFQRLLTQHMPELAAHLVSLQIEAAYLSQWFLSFFAVTCPLPMLFRIYDVIFAEGASETIMRVALSLMRRNEQKIMASNEFEEVMQHLLGRGLWEPYNCNADDLVNDFMGLTGLVTHESLRNLETAFKEAQNSEGAGSRAGFFIPDVSAAASRFLGRLWASNPAAKPTSLSPAPPASRPTSTMHRTLSKLSIASTLNSADISSDSNTSIVSSQVTDETIMSRDSSADFASLTSKSESVTAAKESAMSKEDKDLHGQIEDLLTALTEAQREHAFMATQLQREREERAEDHQMFRNLIDRFRSDSFRSTNALDRRKTAPGPDTLSASSAVPILSIGSDLSDTMVRVEQRLAEHEDLRRSSMLESKKRLRESLLRSKEQLGIESMRTRELSRRLEDQEHETKNIKEELREARSRLQDGHRERQKLERTIQELRLSRSSPESPIERLPMPRSDSSSDCADNASRASVSSVPGLRELRLGRPGSLIAVESTQSTPPKRISSLATQAILATPDHHPANEDDLLLELVNAKTGEATARQELEEVKAKLDAMRRMLGVPTAAPVSPANPIVVAGGHRANRSAAALPTMAGTSEIPTSVLTAAPTKSSPSPPATTSGMTGVFWGWGKRSTSATNVPTVASLTGK